MKVMATAKIIAARINPLLPPLMAIIPISSNEPRGHRHPERTQSNPADRVVDWRFVERLSLENAAQLPARLDAKLPVDLAQVVVDCVCADEQLSRDLRICGSL